MRIARILIVGIAVVFSLLSFPSVLCWILLFWLGAAAWIVRRTPPALATNWQGAFRAAACLCFAMFLAVLRGPMCGTLVGFTLVCLAVVIVICIGQATGKQILLGLAIVFFALGLFAIDRWSGTTANTIATSKPTARTAEENHSQPIVCLGDSLTSGLPSIGGYPPELQKLRGERIINFGHEGITADEAIPMLADLAEISPRVVVVELGGHDFLKKQSRASTKADLLQIVDNCEASGAQVVLCEIPRGFIFDPFYGLEREIARDRDLRLIPDTMIRKLVLFSPFAPPGLWLHQEHRLSDDGLHPNEAGNKLLARTVNLHLGE